MNTPSSVLVIGATGVLGSTIADAFAERGWTVSRGTRKSGSPGDSVHVDLREPDSVARAVQNCDIAVTTVPDPEGVAERVTLEQGGVLLNVATLDEERTRPLEVPGDAAGTVVLNAGLAPGVTNLVVAELLAEHPEADTIEIALGFSTKGMGGKSGVRFVYHNLTSRKHETAVIPFPAPYGRRRCIGFGEDEQGWMRAGVDGRTIHTYASFDSRPLHAGLLALNSIGLLRGIPAAPFMIGRGSIPKTVTTESIVHWVSVRNGSQVLAARSVECQGDYVSCARATAILGAAALDAGLCDRPGCFSSEEVFTLGPLRAELESAGIGIVDRTDTARAAA